MPLLEAFALSPLRPAVPAHRVQLNVVSVCLSHTTNPLSFLDHLCLASLSHARSFLHLSRLSQYPAYPQHPRNGMRHAARCSRVFSTSVCSRFSTATNAEAPDASCATSAARKATSPQQAREQLESLARQDKWEKDAVIDVLNGMKGEGSTTLFNSSRILFRRTRQNEIQVSSEFFSIQSIRMVNLMMKSIIIMRIA